jgi:hypothetical protein
MPEDVKFLGRVSWLRDFSSTRTTGNISGANTTGNALSNDASNELHTRSACWTCGSASPSTWARTRPHPRRQPGVNWGESLFIAGGINQTNAIDIMRLSNPGTQLKEAILPAPMVNFATGLGRGSHGDLCAARLESNYFPPVGSYWSTATVGIGADALGVPTTNRRAPPASTAWRCVIRHGKDVNFGLYVMNYHDKSPVLSTANTTSGLGYSYLEDRKMVGLSANFPLGNWAIGTELSYRPKDAVSLNGSVQNANGGCARPMASATSRPRNTSWPSPACSASPQRARCRPQDPGCRYRR